jgi:hypothetical protein
MNPSESYRRGYLWAVEMMQFIGATPETVEETALDLDHDFDRGAHKAADDARVALALRADNIGLTQSRDNWECAAKANDAVVAQLRADNAALREDAARFAWVLDHPNEFAEIINLEIAWGPSKEDNDRKWRAAIDHSRAALAEGGRA